MTTDIRDRVKRILGACSHCGAIPYGRITEAAALAGISDQTLGRFLNGSRGIQGKKLDLIERWLKEAENVAAGEMPL